MNACLLPRSVEVSEHQTPKRAAAQAHCCRQWMTRTSCTRVSAPLVVVAAVRTRGRAADARRHRQEALRYHRSRRAGGSQSLTQMGSFMTGKRQSCTGQHSTGTCRARPICSRVARWSMPSPPTERRRCTTLSSQVARRSVSSCATTPRCAYAPLTIPGGKCAPGISNPLAGKGV